ncbi:uncharacterized protein BROUX77_003228 [Berkeleyomyces rouxiae]|uniref:uncharacterized protein n=1 Tax=Berkeleyomyces rouxiae TaxID=2035830 RepID=UPI003B7D79C4
MGSTFLPLPLTGLLPILTKWDQTTYLKWRAMAVDAAQEYGFRDYLVFSMEKPETEALALEHGEAKAYKAKRLFNFYLHDDMKSNWIQQYDSLNGREILHALDGYFGTRGILPLVNAVRDIEILIGKVRSIPPLEYATRLRNLNDKLKIHGCEMPPILLSGFMASAGQFHSESWFTRIRHLTDDVPKEQWPTVDKILSSIDTEVNQPKPHSEPVALATVTKTQSKSKKKAKKDKCKRHPWAKHTDDECRANPKNKDHNTTNGNKNSSSGPRVVNFAAANCTVAMNNIEEGDPAHPDLWIVDSGASFHMTADRSLLFDYKRIESSPIQGSGAILRCVGKGTIRINTRSPDGNKVTLVLPDVRHVLNLPRNLLSTSQLWQHGVHFDQRVPALIGPNSDEELAIVRPLHGVYHLLGFAEPVPTDQISPLALATVARNRPQPKPTSTPADLSLWHRRLGHINPANVKKTAAHVLGLELANLDMSSGDKCVPCWTANPSHHSHHERPETRTKRLGDRVHADLIGPVYPESPEGYKYVLMVVDDATRYKWVEFLKSKQADEVLQKMLNILRTRFDAKIRAFHVDGGTEFTSVLRLLEDQGTEVRVTPPYSPSSNGLAERWNGIITGRARAMMHDSGLPHYFWPHAFRSAVHVSNRLACSSNPGNMTPYEAIYGSRPSVAHFVAFGSAAYVLTPEPTRVKSHKIAARIDEGIFIGYQGETIYRVYLTDKKRIVSSRSVRFDENIRPTLPDAPYEAANDSEDEFPPSTSQSQGGTLPGAASLQAFPSTPPLQELASRATTPAIGLHLLPLVTSNNMHTTSHAPAPFPPAAPASTHVPASTVSAPTDAPVATVTTLPQPTTDSAMMDNEVLDSIHESQPTHPERRATRFRRTKEELELGLSREEARRNRLTRNTRNTQKAVTRAVQAVQQFTNASQNAERLVFTAKELLDITTNAARMALGANEGATQAAQAAIEAHRRAHDLANEANTSADAANHLANAASHSANAASQSANEAVVAAISAANRPPPLYHLVEDEVESIASEVIDPRLRQIEYEPEDLSRALVSHPPQELVLHNQSAEGDVEMNEDDPYYYALHTMAADPSTFRQAMRTSHAFQWQQACDEEMNVHHSIPTFSLVPKPKGVPILPSRWVFKTKSVDGKVIRYKARWVACGNFQDPTEYETFSAVASATSLRSVLALAAINHWCVFQADVNTAFLHGQLLPEEHIFIRMPDGYRSNDSSGHELVGKLCRALYGLRHAPRRWFEALEKLLFSLGFHSLDADPCIFLTAGCIIMIHVDDMLVIGPDPVRLRHLYEQIHAVYPMKGLDPVSNYLGIHFSVEPGQINLVQTQYIADLMDRFQMSHLPAKARAVPMTGTTFRNISSPALNSPALNSEDTALYLQMVGSLQWLSCMTRPDITFATSYLARYSHRATTAHLEAAKGVLRYLRSTPTRGICYSASANQGLEAYTDAAFGDHLDRKSTSGYLFKLAGSPISWRAVKQSIQAGSTADAEYLAATIAAKEARYIRRLLADLPQSRNESDLQRPLTLFCDSTNAIANMSRPSINKRTLHLDSAYHFIHEAVQSGWIKPTHVSTENMAADGLTKALDNQKYVIFVRLLGLMD